MVEKELILEERLIETAHTAHPLGNSGRYTVFPHSEEEIIQILQHAKRQGMTVIPMGGGTKRGWGGVEETADIMLSLVDYTGIIDYSAGDMIVTARAGTKLTVLQEHAAKYGQKLPLDPPWPAYATMGGIVAAADSGPKRLRYGSTRDHVIAMRVIYPEGVVMRTGAKVVKNVAGYDMNKLFIGSMGTLGVISEVSCKLRPLPKAESLLLLSFTEEKWQEMKELLHLLLDSMLEPVTLELLTPALTERLGRGPFYMLALAFEDVPSAVHYQERWVCDRLPQASDVDILRDEAAQAWWEAFACLPPHGAEDIGSGVRIAVKIASKNTVIPEMIKACHVMGQQINVRLEAHGGVGHGVSQVYLEGREEGMLACVLEIRRLVHNMGGHAIVRHAPLSFRRHLDVWGNPPAYMPLLEGIKRTIDPDRMVNPGRFIGGI